ncbi:PREDICTED: uncharacterized protein LOC108612869 [Drosophila arizonae]|uniref:Uncharacterized protein LOC108612869 n=1 Tax=Drosophila arizonae TaxID=7263 RepID=A0ABM1P2G8_DROAR|nr:PREDICTED: uncharacterized protein LOC108612869 [Drosophila arizonae]
MDPLRHNEYQTHQSHQPQQHQHVTTYSQHVVNNYIAPHHHKHQQQPPAATPQQQQQEPPQQHLPPHPHYQLGGSSSPYPSSINDYHNTQPTDAECTRSTVYVMSARSSGGGGTSSNPGGTGAASSIMPSTGIAATASGDDPHLQYYTSNRDLTAGKRSTEMTSYPGWQYKTSGTTRVAPVQRHHSSAIYNGHYWLQDEQHQQQQLHSVQQQSRLRYGKSQTATRPIAISCNSSNGTVNGGESSFRYYEDNSKYSTVGSCAKAVNYAPTAPYELLEQVVNPINALLGTSDQQPSPNYARKCPQHYEPPTEQRSANHKMISPQAPSQQQQQHQHQSLYMPSNFQNTVHNAIEKYVRETAPAPNLDYTRKGAIFTRSSAGYYGLSAVSGGNSSSKDSGACVKLEPDAPALARSSLYHNPYSPSTAPSTSPFKESATVAVDVSSRDASPSLAYVYPTKYDKLLPQHEMPTTTGTGTAIAGEQRRSSFSSINNYTGYYNHGTPSPAAAQVASPLPAQQLYNNTPPPTGGTHTVAPNYSTLQVYPHGPDICCQPSTALKSAPSLASGPKKAPSSSKPNYRALINDMLKRNTTSEEELNLQIIKKTLNMETSGSRLSTVPTVPARIRQSPVTITVHPTLPPVIQQPQAQLNPQPPPQPTLPTAQSPLDLSMRTIKQTADSTEYKYQRMPIDSFDRNTVSGTGTGTGLPRFDITPNFARTNRVVSSPSAALPAAVIRQAPANTALPVEATSMVIKAAQQLRPSVLETNPYARRTQLPPETSVKVVPTPAHSPSTTSTCTAVSTITNSAHNSSNPNYLGRKRHLQEYNQATAAAAAAVEAATEAAAKQSRLETPQIESIVDTSVPVIAANKQAPLAKRVEQPILPSSSRVIVCSQPKQEQLVVPKTESRIRTKAELKGFTFTTPDLTLANSTKTTSITTDIPTSIENNNSATVDTTTSTPALQPNNVSIQIKLEPVPTPEPDVKDVDFGDSPSFNSSSLCDWGSTCNNLVKQLLCKLPAKTTSGNESIATTSRIKLELSEDDLPVARILKRQPLTADVESAATTTTQLTNTTTTNGNAFSAAQKKLSKTEREKKRLMQEQRIAARLAPTAGHSSSSESDSTELRKRKTARQKKPLMRKNKARRTDDKEMQLKHCEQPSSDEEQKSKPEHEQEKRINSICETKNSANATKILTPAFKKTKVQYASVTCKKIQIETQRGKVIRQKQNPEGNADDKTSSNGSGNSDDEEPREQQGDDVEEDGDEDENMNAGEDSACNYSNRKAKPTFKNRIALNTMTRSKRKKELELQLANSKVLRNDKIIRNSTTKIKRKYVRKLVPDSKKEIMITRLRNKRDELIDRAPLSGRKLKNNPSHKSGRPTNNKTNISQTNATPQQQLFLEEYRYKLALKIPQRLISINKLNKLPQVAASLPDLDRGRYLTQDMASFKPTRGRKPRSKLPQQQSQQQQKTTPKSIIDVLHLRVTSNNNNNSQQQHTNSNLSNCATSLHNYSETSQTSASNSLYEHLQEAMEPSMEDNTLGKRHFSIFDTKVLQSKTRTESKLQQRREIIREIFVGTERPASAPPECAQHDQAGEECAALSYQQYEDFLDQMNRIVTANNNKLFRHNISGEAEQKTETHLPSRPVAYKRKYLRRKGSSGFDYIRKKKRPTHHHQNTNTSNSTNTINTVSGDRTATNIFPTHTASATVVETVTADDERLDDTDSTIAGSTSHLPMTVKTEMDVCREIQKWVLNKGVGQSTMHKAARQGLIDVVVYCLDRMGMNPNQKDNAGYTPLHEACTQGWLEIARILLQFGANHSEAAQSGIRPLHGAIENDHEEVVRLLLSYGADPLLATYSGQTPLMLASSKLMFGVLSSHLSDAQSAAEDIKPMRFPGPWEIFDEKENGFNIFDNLPNTACDMSRAQARGRIKQKRSHGDNDNPAGPKTDSEKKNINELLRERKDSKETINANGEINAKTATKTIITSTAIATESATAVKKTETTATQRQVKLEPGAGIEDTNNNNNRKNNINVEQNVTSVVNDKNEVKQEPQYVDNLNINSDVKGNGIVDDRNDQADDEQEYNDDDRDALSDELNGDIFKFEEADVPLPPLYLLKDEGSDKWVLLNDLCNLLKVKSKDTLLNKICPNGNSQASNQKQLLREFKIDDFLKQATCLQLLCAGEKLNMFSSSKVVLIRYNDSVKNLLGVKTILMKF